MFINTRISQNAQTRAASRKARRAQAEFRSALRNADPTMYSELLCARDRQIG